MVKKYMDLLLDTRKALLKQEDMEIADMMAKHLIAHVSGKSVPGILADRDSYATDEICTAVEKGLRRLLEGEPSPIEEADIRWIDEGELRGFDWAEADDPLIDLIAEDGFGALSDI